MKNKRLGRCKNQTSLLKKFEKLIKPIILKRDSHACGVGSYRHSCSSTLVVDHRPAKRGHHSTFLDPRNLTTVCSNANWQAERDPLLSYAIIQKVIEREGDIIEDIHILSSQPKKWSEEECYEWLEKCREHFLVSKNGKPTSSLVKHGDFK